MNQVMFDKKQGRWVQKWKVESYSEMGSSNGKPYTVSVSSEMVWGCSCPHWRFRRAECKHIREIKTRLSVAEGNNAAHMRLLATVIEKLKRQGKSDEEITNYLTDHQGNLFDFSQYENGMEAAL